MKNKRRINRIKSFFNSRQHPVIILSYMAKYLWLMLIPLAKYLIATRFDIQGWVKANWIDILTISFIFVYAFARWLFVYYETCEDCIIARTGFFGINKTQVYFSQMSSMSLSQGYFFRMIKACSVYIDTDAKSVSAVDIKLDLTEKRAFELYKTASKKAYCNPKYTFKAGKRDLVAFSFLFSSALSGVALVLTAMYQAYRVVGREAEEEIIRSVNTRIESLPILASVPKYILLAGGLIAGGWLISFIANLVRHWNFSCRRCGELLLIRSGVISRRRHIIARKSINYFDFSQSLLMKLFKVCSVSVSCTGYGKRRKEISAVIPITTSEKAADSLKFLMPDMPKERRDVYSDRRDISKFISVPLAMCLIPPGVWFALNHYFPYLRLFNDWEREFDMVMIIAMIPLLWRTAVRFAAVFTTYIGLDSESCTLSYCSAYKFHKVIMERDKISQIQISQHPMQKINGSCTIIVFTKSETIKMHCIRCLNYKKVTELLNRNGFTN